MSACLLLVLGALSPPHPRAGGMSRRALLAGTAGSVLTAAAASAARPPPAGAFSQLLATAEPAPAAAAAASAAPASSASAELVSGLVAGAAQKTVKQLVLHPLDTLKTRLQLGADAPAGGLLSREMYRDVYSGVWPALLSGAPAAGVFFGAKDYLTRLLASAAPDLALTPATVATVGGANVVYWLVRNPSEVIKARRQAGQIDDAVSASAELWAERGAAGFYRGYASNFWYGFPVDASKFVLYGGIKQAWRERKGGAKLSPLEAAVGGAVAAACAQGISTPLDVARTRIMTAPAGEPAQGVVDVMAHVARSEGTGALYAGLPPKLARAVASGALQFGVYESVKAAVDSLILGTASTRT